MKLKFVIFILLFNFSCKNENNKNYQETILMKEAEIDSLKNVIEWLKNNSESTSFNESGIRDYSNEEIIEIVKNEIAFNCPKTQIKDFVIRKTANDLYEVRFYQRLKEYQGFYWEKAIVHIKVYPDDKYVYDLYNGTHCQE